MKITGKINGLQTDISDLKYWCQFIGSVRSGHTLVAQILNSHKDVLISDELEATRLYDIGATKYEVFNAVRERADKYFKGGNKTWINRYTIGQYQNKTDHPIIIGDKMCGTDTRKFGDSDYLEKYIKFIGLPFKFIWVLRDPVQNINGKLMLGRKAKNKKYYTLESNILEYKAQYSIAKEIERRYDVKRVYLNNIINNTENEIVSLFDWIGIEADNGLIDSIKDIVFGKHHTHDVKWNDSQLRMIEDEIFDYKANYEKQKAFRS